ncbi:MAG: type II toxin-antitoxin system PemK/MazF family toxin [Chitinophagaceae bacterium]|nr:type II toxin-antitoxin system PemK/MazF family toxin [Chitinophagaceae bacterium]
MKQGEIWYADLEPVKGSEQAGKRPVVIISGPAMNIALSIVITCPLTSIIKNIKGCIVIEKNENNNLKKNSEVLVFHVRTISKVRLSKKIGSISKNQTEQIKEGINLYLNY